MARRYIQHNLIALRSQAHERRRHGRSLVDRRSASGQNALRVQAELIADQGGIEHLSTARLVLIELVARDVYFLDETDRRIVRTLNKYPKIKHNPAAMSKLYGYRSVVAKALAGNLALLGLDKVPSPTKSLEELFTEEEQADDPEKS